MALAIVATGHGARADSGEFSLQVSPSPLVATLKPGQASTLDLHIRNMGAKPEQLKITPRSFTVDSKQQLHLDDALSPDLAGWISFSAPTFSVMPGQSVTVSTTIHVPSTASYSYSFALVIGRTDATTTQSTAGGRTLNGSVAVFALLNIDRPGATRSLQVVSFKPSERAFEYLPAHLNVELKNTGNTIVRPTGNVFIQRGANDSNPIDTLSFNGEGGYILPGQTRTFAVDWTNGFQVMSDVKQSDGSTKQQLTWNWANIGSLRIGHFTAKLVAIYNDGQRDIPLESQASFWVFPWKLMLGALVVLALVGVGIWSVVRSFLRIGKRIVR